MCLLTLLPVEDFSKAAEVVEVLHHGQCCAYRHKARQEGDHYDEFYNGTVLDRLQVGEEEQAGAFVQEYQLHPLPGGQPVRVHPGEVPQPHLCPCETEQDDL